MPYVNYVREHERFIEYAADERLTVAEMALWEALFHIMNARATGSVWPDGFIRITNKRVLTYCPVKFDTMAAARNRLKQRGLIDFVPGDVNHSPMYKMNYFYPENDSYSKNWDSLGDKMGNRTGDSMGERLGDKTGDNIINYTGNEDITIPPEEDNPTTEEIARAQASELYPKRERALTRKEEIALASVLSWLDYAKNVRQMYGEYGMALIMAMLESDRFTIDLVIYAMEKTIERNERYEFALDNPIAYTQKLLQDWESRGFKTREDVQESKDDWGHFG